jgi:hypothetical protein
VLELCPFWMAARTAKIFDVDETRARTSFPTTAPQPARLGHSPLAYQPSRTERDTGIKGRATEF